MMTAGNEIVQFVQFRPVIIREKSTAMKYKFVSICLSVFHGDTGN